MPSSTTGVSRSAAVTSFRKTSKSPFRMVVKRADGHPECQIGFQFMPSRSSAVSNPSPDRPVEEKAGPLRGWPTAAWSPRGDERDARHMDEPGSGTAVVIRTARSR